MNAATRLGLTGLVRNRPDGSVEGEAQGDKTAVEKFILELKTGHPQAEILSAETTRMEERKGEKDFIIDY